MAMGKKKQVRSINKAVRSTVESLETRLHLTAGQLDWSWADRFTYSTYGYRYWSQSPASPLDMDPDPDPAKTMYGFPLAYNPTNVAYTDTFATWNGVPPYLDSQTIIHDAAVDSGGRLIVVGEQMGHHLYKVGSKNYGYWDRDFHVARYRKDGSLETFMFPNSGVSDSLGNLKGDQSPYAYPRSNPYDLDDRAFGVAIEPDFMPDGVTPNPYAGAIFVAGTHNDSLDAASIESGLAIGQGGEVAFARYVFTQNTILRNLNWFDVTGYSLLPTNSVTDVAIVPVGNTWKYLIAGSVANSVTGQNFALWRFNQDGTLDTEFGRNDGDGVNGRVSTTFQSYSNDEITQIVVQPDGKIVVVGYADDTVWNDQLSGAHVRMMVARYTINGDLDTDVLSGAGQGFNVVGYTEINAFGGKNARANAVMLQKDGRILVAGTFDQFPTISSADSTAYDTGVVARLTTNGLLDTTFGSRGRLYINDVVSTRPWRAQSIAEQSDGKIVVGGTVDTGFDLVRLSANGQLDLAYGGAGNGHANLYNNPTPLPMGQRFTRTSDRETWSMMEPIDYQGYHYDAPALVLGKGEDVDKAYIMGNYDPTAVPGSPLEFGGVLIARIQTDNTPPTAELQAYNIELEQVGATAYTFRVTYNDNILVSRESIDVNDVVVIGPSGNRITVNSINVVGYTSGPDADGLGQIDHRSYVVEYTITPPGGTWDAADNGRYVIRLLQNQIKDVEGAAIATPLVDATQTPTEYYTELGNFMVGIYPPDVTPPTAMAPGLASNMTVGGRPTYRFDVIFTEIDSNGNSIIDAGERVSVASLSKNSVVTVIGPNSYRQNARFVSVNDPTDGTPRVATYEIDAPGGMWEITDNGVYYFNINANIVSDDYVSPNYIQAAELGRLTVSIVTGQDVRPVASRVDAIDTNSDNIPDSFPPISNQSVTAGTDLVYFYVRYDVSAYADPATVLDRNTIIGNDNAIRVTSNLPAFNGLAKYVKIVAAGPSDKWLVVQYSITPADGFWSEADSGTYSIALQPNQIGDKNDPLYPPSFAPAAALGSITVNIVDPDLLAPTVDQLSGLQPPAVMSLTYDVAVTYHDDKALDLASISSSNIELRRLQDNLVLLPTAGAPSTIQSNNGRQFVVTYHFGAPNSAWDFLANGTWVINVRDNQVRDMSGKFVVGAQIGSFTFAGQGPSATFSNPVWGNGLFTVQVLYRDVAVNLNTISLEDIVVERTDNANYLQLDSAPSTPANPNPRIINSTPGSITVAYSFLAPGGWWEYKDNGAYTIRLASSTADPDGSGPQVWTGVSVTSGQLLPATTLATFQLAIEDDLVPPTVTAGALPDITDTAVSSYVFMLSYADQRTLGTPGAVDLASIIQDYDPTKGSDVQSTYDVYVHTPSGEYWGATLSQQDLTATVSGSPIAARYRITKPGGEFTSDDNGVYTIYIGRNGVMDVSGNPVSAGFVGTFRVKIGDNTPPVATITPPVPVPVIGSITYDVTVTYTDADSLLSVSSFDSNDIQVVRFGSDPVTDPDVVLVAASAPTISALTDGTPRSVTYHFYAPGPQPGVSTWNYEDQGQWQIVLQAGEVEDTNANIVDEAVLGSFEFVDLAPVVTASAVITPAAPSAGDMVVTFTITDDQGIDVTTINENDFSVYGSNLGLLNLVPGSMVIASSGTTATVTLHYAARAEFDQVHQRQLPAFWEWKDNDTYNLAIQMNAVEDLGGQANVGENGVNFGVVGFFNLFLPADFAGPTATVTSVPNVNGPGINVLPFTVRYTDNVAVDVSSLGDDDIDVVSPDGSVRFRAKLVPGSVNPNTSSGTIDAIYQINLADGPISKLGAKWLQNGQFSFADNGIWTIRLLANTIYDVSGNPADPAIIGQFTVQVPDEQPPQVQLVDSLVSPEPMDTQYIVQVVYTDESGIDLTTIDANDLVIERTANGAPLTLTSAGAPIKDPQDALNRTVVVTYTFNAPGGTWNYLDNGTYTVRLAGAQVRDISGNVAATQDLGTFDFNDEPPTAALVDPLPTVTLGTSDISITVEYDDEILVDSTTFTAGNGKTTGDIRVFKDINGKMVYLQPVGAPTWVLLNDGTAKVHVTYTFAPTNGYWDPSDSGEWTIALGAAEVADAGGAFAVGGTLGSFTVDLGEDTTAPVPSLSSAPTITAPVSSYTITVRYDDDTAVDYQTLGNGDVAVIGPNGTVYTTTLVSASTTFGTTVQAVYRVNKPGGWNATDNGAYQVTMVANQVKDVSGNAIDGGTSVGTFRVACPVPAVVAHLANIGPVQQGAVRLTFQVTFSSSYLLDMSTLLNKSNIIRVTGPKQFDQLARYVSIDSTSPGLDRTVTYSVAAPGGQWDFSDNGKYTIAITSNNGVKNIAGGALLPGTLGDVAVALQPTVIRGSDLIVNGTDGSDMIEVLLLNNDDTDPYNDVVKVIVNNVESFLDRVLVDRVVINGLAGNDTIKIDPGVPKALIYGGDGNDTIWGGDFNDTIYGQAGDDVLYGGGGANFILGGLGNDDIYGGAGADTLYGDAGNDTMDGGAGNDLLWGSVGNDSLLGGAGNDLLYGAEGNDTLDGGAGNDILHGGKGDDLLLARDGSVDILYGEDGNDTAVIDQNGILDRYFGIEKLLA